MSVIDTTVKTERLPGPFPANRLCSCGAKLSRYNPAEVCATCNGGEWAIPQQDPHPAQIARIGMERGLEDLAA